MRKIAATCIFPCNRPPVKNGILICEDDGTIVDLLDTEGKIEEASNLEYYSGILVPGFVNTHCHLELSHLQGKIQEQAGMGGFVGMINKLRHGEKAEMEKAADKADRRMWSLGTAAVGDVSNSPLTIETKRNSRIKYHTFVESFGFLPARSERAFQLALRIQGEFLNNGLSASIVPHAPYSVSEPLFRMIKEAAVKEKGILSFHLLESLAEIRFYYDGTGPIAAHLNNNLGIDTSHWHPSGKSPITAVIDYLPPDNQLLLIHNTFMEKQDLTELRENRSLDNTFFVLCPNSNLYIENSLPPVDLFLEENVNICLGTDSLASNHSLSILAEMITLQKAFPELVFDKLIKWACLNGARALKIEDEFGSFEPGKRPGVNLITGVDVKSVKLTEKSKVRRLV